MPSNALTASPPGYQHRSPGTAHAAGSRLALADAQQRYDDVIGDFPI